MFLVSNWWTLRTLFMSTADESFRSTICWRSSFVNWNYGITDIAPMLLIFLIFHWDIKEIRTNDFPAWWQILPHVAFHVCGCNWLCSYLLACVSCVLCVLCSGGINSLNLGRIFRVNLWSLWRVPRKYGFVTCSTSFLFRFYWHKWHFKTPDRGFSNIFCVIKSNAFGPFAALNWQNWRSH